VADEVIREASFTPLIGYADPEARIGMGYTMNKMKISMTEMDPRWAGMIPAIYSSL